MCMFDPSDRFTDALGKFAAEIIRRLQPGPDDASLFQDYVEHHLKLQEFEVRREVACPRGPTRRGRMDIVATSDSTSIGIELDWKKPRYASLAKLRQFPGYRIIVLRRSDPFPYPIAGIDEVVSVPVVEPLRPFLAGQQATLQA